MSIFELLKQRRAVRNYMPKEVEDDKIVRLLEAAVWAPNDRLREPWHFYVLRGDAKRRYQEVAEQFLQERFPTKPHLVRESLQVLENTPLIIVVTADIVEGDEASSEDNEYAVACAIHSMWLAAAELGLGMVWRTRGVGLVRDKRIYDVIGATADRKVIGSLFIGYPADQVTATARKPVDEKVTWL
ncbi:cobalamin biosynthesis protein CbiY [Gordoniibacillus kamchatkensis]|uniref:Cobalamin biosynthesis protein CbiY n=1 Tax=Gordoniibacillus kamchatkensis TaxID=1590651 RepID=A0ABR5AC90_9BACL|nr:nitroreductase [Paenibacillus sp. VKM B-2647]KIL38656.1 cobalamin biosynthesis protein CbiY [Paenibacillus sp. VKM B-2647]